MIIFLSFQTGKNLTYGCEQPFSLCPACSWEKVSTGAFNTPKWPNIEIDLFKKAYVIVFIFDV